MYFQEHFFHLSTLFLKKLREIEQMDPIPYLETKSYLQLTLH